MPNNELLLDTLEIVRKADAQHRELVDLVVPEFRDLYWDQSTWLGEVHEAHACGTAMCFAGWAVWLSGYTEMVKVTDPDAWDPEDDQLLALRNPKTGGVVTYDQISLKAEKLLGINGSQAVKLFYSENTIAHLIGLVASMTDEEDD